MTKELDIRRLRGQPLSAANILIKQLEEYPIGILDESERTVFAEARASVGLAQEIARIKAIELGDSARKPRVWDRFRRCPKDVLSKQKELRYKGLPVHLLQEGEVSVASDTQCTIEKTVLDPDKKHNQVGDVYNLPYSESYGPASSYYVSNRYVKNFITIGEEVVYQTSLRGKETYVQLVECGGLPVFVINKRNEYNDTKPIFACTIEPSDAEKRIYHIRFNFPGSSHLIEFRSTDRKGTFNVRQLEEASKE